MLFTSYEFILFLGIVFILYYLVPKKMQWKFLLLASYAFYFIASPFYLIYILATTVTTFLATRQIRIRKESFQKKFDLVKKELDREQRKEMKEQEKKHQFRLTLFCLLFNLGILAVVKYTNFAIANVNAVIRLFDKDAALSFVNLIIPMGISFYTFQSMGYLIDVYQGKYEAEKNPFKVALFISFFPQLVQGPISRFDELSKSLFAEHRADYRTITFGLQRILWAFSRSL